ncbi:hypothetical protein [Nostoc sp. S13]|nr:hypothetical protein [Nostoc sp. S13]
MANILGNTPSTIATDKTLLLQQGIMYIGFLWFAEVVPTCLPILIC